MRRWSHPDYRPAGSNRESGDTAAWDSFDSIKWAGPNGPAAWHRYHYTAERTESHVHHPNHPGQICAYLSSLWPQYECRVCEVCLVRRSFLVSMSCFSTSRCVPASMKHCQHASRSWWVWWILSLFESSSTSDVVLILCFLCRSSCLAPT